MTVGDSASHPSASVQSQAPVYAIIGPTAGMVAYNLASMLARNMRGEGWHIMLVDAEGYVSQRVLPGTIFTPADRLLAGAGRLDDYLIHDEDSGLRILPQPEQEASPTQALVERLRGEFNVLFIACGKSRYAEHWFSAADSVVVSAASTRELNEALNSAKRLRDQDGALLAPMGRLKLPDELMDYCVFRLPSSRNTVFKEAENSGKFATLADEEIRKAFEPLLQELLDKTERCYESTPPTREETSWQGGAHETSSEKLPEDSAAEPYMRSSPDARGAKRLSADEIVEKMRQGVRRSDHREQESDTQTDIEAEVARVSLGGRIEELKASFSSLAGRLQRRGGSSAARTEEASMEDLEQRLKLSLRETAVGSIARVCVGSPKGGVGKSSIAYALAGSMSYYTNMRVCLVDADPNFGSTRLLVPRPIEHSVVTLAEAGNNLRGLSDLRKYVAQDEKMRLDIVLGPEEANELARLEDLSEAYAAIDSVLSRFYDLVVYDLGLGFRDSAIRRVLSLSNELLFVTDSEVIPNAMLADAIKYVENLGVSLERTTLVLNHRLPPTDESAATPQVRNSYTSRLGRVIEVPYDAQMSQLLNRRSFHIEELTLRTRLGILTAVAASLQSLREASGAADKVVNQGGAER